MPLELPDGWREQLPEDIRDNGVLNDIKDIDQMAKMIVNARQLQTHQISIPGEDASPEKRKEFLSDLQEKIPDLVYVGEGADLGNLYDRMGRPAAANEYQLGEIPDPLKDNFANLASKAHEMGVTEGQMKGMTDAIIADYDNNMNTHTAKMDATKESVKKLFGQQYDEKVKATADFAKQVGFDENIVKAINDGVVGLDNMKAFDQMMDGYKSPGPRIGDQHGADGFDHLTPGQAEMKISEMLNNKEHPYWNGSDPAHAEAVQRMLVLTEAADAGKELSEADKFREALAGNG